MDIKDKITNLLIRYNNNSQIKNDKYRIKTNKELDNLCDYVNTKEINEIRNLFHTKLESNHNTLFLFACSANCHSLTIKKLFEIVGPEALENVNNTGSNPLINACKQKVMDDTYNTINFLITEIEKLPDANKIFNQVDKQDYNALLYVNLNLHKLENNEVELKNKLTSIIKKLIEKGGLEIQTEKQGFELLKMCIQNLKKETFEIWEPRIIELLINDSMNNILEKNRLLLNNDSPLLWACRNDFNDIVTILIQKIKNNKKIKIDVNQVDETGKNALLWACHNLNREVALELIKLENISMDQVDDTGRTALLWACKNNWEDVAIAIINKNKSLYRRRFEMGHPFGVSLQIVGDIRPYEDSNVPFEFFKGLKTIGQVNVNGNTALLIASNKKMYELTKLLLETNHSNPEYIKYIDGKPEATALKIIYDNYKEISSTDNSESLKLIINQIYNIYIKGSKKMWFFKNNYKEYYNIYSHIFSIICSDESTKGLLVKKQIDNICDKKKTIQEAPAEYMVTQDIISSKKGKSSVIPEAVAVAEEITNIGEAYSATEYLENKMNDDDYIFVTVDGLQLLPKQQQTVPLLEYSYSLVNNPRPSPKNNRVPNINNLKYIKSSPNFGIPGNIINLGHTDNHLLGGKKTYKRKTYKRKTYKRKTYKRKTYKRNKKQTK